MLFKRSDGEGNENCLVFPLVKRKIHSTIIIVTVRVYCVLTRIRHFKVICISVISHSQPLKGVAIIFLILHMMSSEAQGT